MVAMALVKLYVGRDSMDAHFVRAQLEAHGIPATVMGENLSFARGDLPMTLETLPSVWVNEQHSDEAKQIVAELSDAQQRSARGEATEQPAPWTCPGCDEKVEGQFDQCWKCGTSREGELFEEDEED